MAAEMSCLTGVDEDDKDPDTEVNALTLLQNPVRVMQETSSCTISFHKPSPKQNCVLDAMSNADMLSPVGLGNGPSSHQATEALDINSINIEKEEEKNITQLKTVQEIDSAGIWGFDVESPENSLDNLSGTEELSWDPHREFMQFLWENNSNDQGGESKEDVTPVHSFKKRKRKMDMVVMADPSADLYHDISPGSSDDLSDADVQLDTNSVRKALKSRKLTKSPLSPTGKVSSYPNGTAKAIKDILYTTSPRNSHENHKNHGLSSLKRKLMINSESERKPPCYPCLKCNLEFKTELHLNRHMKSHAEPSSISQKSFVCRECGESFRQSHSLIEHMSTHQGKNPRLADEIKSTNEEKKVDKNARFYCPQCSFGTDSTNAFVQHAKTHEKDKKKFRCDKCSFKGLCEVDLRRHDIMQHTVITDRKPMQSEDSDSFSCNICSYKTFNKNVFKNHLLRRHQQTFEDYKSSQLLNKNSQLTGNASDDAEITSKISIKNQIGSKTTGLGPEPSDISDLFKNSKMKRAPKSQFTESKLDKSINVLLSRQRLGKKATELKDCNNSKSSAVSSKADDESRNELPDTRTIKAKESVNHQSPNGPRFNAEPSGIKKSSSKRKMSTPYHNTNDQESCFISPKPLQSADMVHQGEEELENDIFQFKESDSSSTLFDNNVKKEKQNIIYTYSRRMSMRGALQASKRLFEKIKSEEQTNTEPEIKEECIETDVFQETFEPHQIPLGESLAVDFSELDSEHNCPYCPAIFESGVGLSNHVRGHLHRVGLAYNARHVVPPEQVACQDRRPRIRRKISALRRLKKVLQQESDSETVRSVHSCPLCGDSFDNRTGQSNHIRGHLKKIGRNFASKSKSPLVLLRELMRDKREFQRALQIIGKRRNHYQYGASPQLPSVDPLTSSPASILQGTSFPSLCNDAKPPMPPFSVAELDSEERHLETKSDSKDSLAGTTALIGILKKRKCQEDGRLKASPPIPRSTQLLLSPSIEQDAATRIASSLPNSVPEKGEFNRKVCIHCNATFHSGVSLSNHLRAYAKRQRIALLEGTTIDCKAVRTRSRPGSKKKTLPINQTPEEIYRLTCRFCDLVFQGPLSVQEDWVKHLQRHIMNTGVPHTGLGMVEVTSSSRNPPTLKTEEDSSPTAAGAASS